MIELIVENESKIAYAVLSIERSLGGNRLYPVPWSALRPSADPRDPGSLVLQASMERLSRAPSFHKNNWPDMNDQGWCVALQRYYSAAAAPEPARAEAAEAARTCGAELPASRPGQRSVRGILVSIERLSSAEAGSRCTRLKLQNEEGIVVVQLGPFPLSRGDGVRLELDESLEVTGVMARTSAGPLLLARELRAGKTPHPAQQPVADAVVLGPRD